MDVSLKKQRTSDRYIPDDVLYLIFTKLGSKLDEESFGLTCRRFLDIQSSSKKSLKIGPSHHPVIRRCVFFNPSFPPHFVSIVLESLLSRFTQLESLSLGCCLEIKDSDLTILLNYPSKLHSLYLNYCHHVTNIGLSLVVSACPLLSVICLSKTLITDSGLEILTKSCKSLREVNISWCKNITDNGISYVNQNCSQLRSLNISGCKKIAGVPFKGCFPTLACLKATFCYFKSTCVCGILSGGGLQYLDLTGFLRLKLAPISLEFSSNLKKLNLKSCNFVYDDVVMKIAIGCPLLQEWNLTDCSNIEFDGWRSIGSHCQNLEILHVSQCKKLCDNALWALGNGCKRLSLIYLTPCKNVSKLGVNLFKSHREDVKIKEEVLWTIVPHWAFRRGFF